MAKILLVDDDLDLSGMVEDWLTFEEHAVTLVHLGYEGWQQLQTNEFDLAILDWDMPDLNGIDLLKRYRSSGGKMPVIMLTGRTSIDDKEQGLDLGANDYLTKPFHLKELSARIRAVLRNSASAAPPPPKSLGSGNEEILKIGNLVGTALAARYEFLEVIGTGGVAVVFKARQPHMDKLMAVKMLQATEMNEEMIARFEREARAISRADHPNIITIHDFGITEHRRPYMVMEYIEGKALDAILRQEFKLPLERGLEIMHQVSDGLAHAHALGILHRDIKPSNIMLKPVIDQDPIPKILDFGLAKLTVENTHNEKQLTQEHHTVGSPPYMSPEQVRGKPQDERSDVYQLGCVIFETVTGYAAFDSDTIRGTILMHLDEEPFSFEEVQPDLEYPQELKQLVAKALKRDPEDRYQTMKELSNDLGAILQKLRSPAEQH